MDNSLKLVAYNTLRTDNSAPVFTEITQDLPAAAALLRRKQ